jgi:hypothetical protein
MLTTLLMLMRKNVGKLSKNVDEKKWWRHILKMLRKMLAPLSKNVNEKMLVTLLKNVD